MTTAPHPLTTGDTAMTTLTIGDSNRDGTLVIRDTAWDSNGTMRVTVEDLCGPGGRVGGMPIPAMRRLARRALAHPEHTRSSRVIRVGCPAGCQCGTARVTFAVSRLPRY